MNNAFPLCLLSIHVQVCVFPLGSVVSGGTVPISIY